MQSRINRSVAHKLLKRAKQKVSETRKKTKDNILNPVRSRAASLRNKVRRDQQKLTSWIKSEGARYTQYLKPYAVYVFIYGALLNYTLNVLLSFPLTYYTVPAWGIAYYFLKEELTEFIFTVRGMNNR